MADYYAYERAPALHYGWDMLVQVHGIGLHW